MVRRIRKTRKAQHKKHRTLKNKSKRMRGGGIKEDAMKVITDNVKDIFTKLLYAQETKTMNLDGFTFKVEGRMGITVKAKKIGSSDDFVEIYTVSDH